MQNVARNHVYQRSAGWTLTPANQEAGLAALTLKCHILQPLAPKCDVQFLRNHQVQRLQCQSVVNEAWTVNLTQYQLLRHRDDVGKWRFRERWDVNVTPERRRCAGQPQLRLMEGSFHFQHLLII